MFWLKYFKKGYKLTMPKKTTTVSRKATKKTPVTVAKVEDIVDKSLRKVLQDQARELESHLSDIDKRLRALEGK